MLNKKNFTLGKPFSLTRVKAIQGQKMIKQFSVIAFLLLACLSVSAQENNSADTVYSTVRSYYEDGTLATEINYINGKPIGVYRFYYPDGTLMEEGVWNEEHLTGSFKRYHSNGQLAQEFTYDEDGNRVGTQKYFYSNGGIQAEKQMGPPEHIIVRYTKDGQKKVFVSF